MRGRKPTPTALKVLRGNPGKREHNPREPQHGPLDDAVPTEIADDAIAVAEWQRLMPGLSTCGQLTVGERGAMIGYCLKYAQWIAQEQRAAAGPMLVTGSAGQLAINPAIKLANQTFLLFLRAAVEIGLTPSSRSRIVAHPSGSSASKWHGVLK